MNAGLDAQLSPPELCIPIPDGTPPGYRLPAAAARCDGEWRTGAAFGQCTDPPHDRGQCVDATGHKFYRRTEVTR